MFSNFCVPIKFHYESVKAKVGEIIFPFVVHMQAYGGVPALGGRKYPDFRGTYMGLAPHGHPKEEPLPFPLVVDAVKNPHFFYVCYLDGGHHLCKLLADIREGISKEPWPNVNPDYLRAPDQFLSSGSKSV